MTVLVTGASGFIGAALARALGEEAVPATRTGAPGARLGASAGRVIRLDPRDPDAVVRVLTSFRPEAVVHTAVSRDADGQAVRDTEVGMVDAVCRGAAQADVRTVVTFGSATEYGRTAPPLRETMQAAPATAHGAAKAAGVAMARSWGQRVDGPEVVVLRPFHVTGRGEPLDKLVPRVLAAAHGGPPVPLVAGAPVRDLIHVEDVVAAIRAAVAQPPDDGLPVNLCSGASTTPSGLVAAVERALGRAVPVRGVHPRTAYDDEQRIGDPARAAALWGWEAAALDVVVDRCLRDWPWGAP